MNGGCFPPAGMALRACLAVGAVLALTGCQSPEGQSAGWGNLLAPREPLAVATAPAETDTESLPAGLTQSPVAALQLSFDVLRTRVHQGVFSESGKIWNHLDEQFVPADMAVTLQRNGLRIARGKMNAWPPIKAIFDAEKDVNSVQNAMMVGNGLPLTIELDAQPHDQTLFLFRRDGTLGGVTLPTSMNLLRIEYTISVSNPDSVLLEVMPEIRLQPTDPSPTLQGWMGRRMVPPSRVFRELAVQVEIGPDEFLAIGPSPAAHHAHTMGSLLLSQEFEGQRYECMFFITPRVIRRDLPSTGNAGAGQAAITAQDR